MSILSPVSSSLHIQAEEFLENFEAGCSYEKKVSRVIPMSMAILMLYKNAVAFYVMTMNIAGATYWISVPCSICGINIIYFASDKFAGLKFS